METEVICISSDDEPELQQKNKEDTSLSATTQVVNKCKSPILLAKDEVLSSEDEKVQENSLKRRLPKQDDEKESVSHSKTEKRRKLHSASDESKITGEDTSIALQCTSVQSDKAQEVINDNPKLIVKEKIKISYVAYDIFPVFISLCLQKCHDNDMMKIVSKLKRRYEELDPVYATSESFISFVNEKRMSILQDNMKLYVYIQEVMDEMKRKVRKKSQSLSNGNVYDAVPSTSYATNNLLVNKGNENSINESDYEEEVNTNSRETSKKVKQILKAMNKCEVMIKKLEEAEVDFNDEADSNYVKSERYKERMVELYNKLCDLTGENFDAGRVYLRPKHISTTRIVVIDQAITNFINSKIYKQNQLKRSGVLTNDLIFPDYTDILQCISKCNDKKKLGLDKRKQEEMAKNAFRELGEYLQRARRNDYWDTFSLYLENTEEDPAIKDKELARKLSDNRAEGEKRLAAIFEKYAKKQEEVKQQNSNETSSDDNEDEESSVDNEDENKCNLSVNYSSNENSDKEKDVDKTISKNNLFVDIKKDSISIEKSNQNSDKILTNTIKASSPEIENNKEINIQTCVSNSDVTTIENKNEAVNTEKTCSSNTTDIILKTKNKISSETKLQKDSLSTSTSDCTSTVDRTEEQVAEMLTRNLPIGKTDAAAKVIKFDVTETITNEVPQVIKGDISEVVTTNITEEKKEDVEMEDDAKEDIAETLTENVTEVTMEDMAEVASEKQEEEKKPLLRVRSFAKPPMTWEDGRQKTEKNAEEITPQVANHTKDVIDLTNDVAKPMSVITKCAIQLGNKIVPIVKARHQTLVIPSGSIISVKNITNNYLKVNPRTGKIIAPVRDIHKPTVIQTPSGQTIIPKQIQSQNVNAPTVRTDVRLKGKEILRIFPRNKIILPSNSAGQIISKEKNVCPSMKRPK